MDKKVVSIYIPEKLYKKIKVEAAKRSTTIGNLIEVAVQTYFMKGKEA